MNKTCEYFLIENPHTSTVIPLSIFITILSTIVNLVGFYVILFKSTKETKLYLFTLFGNQLSLWIAQGFWAIFMNTMPLFPFPAFYSTNVFNFSTHATIHIWVLLLGVFAVFLGCQLIVRHKMIVRASSFFNFDNWVYICALILGWCLLNGSLLTVWTLFNNPYAEKFLEIQKSFPGCQKVFDLPGVLVITDANLLYVWLGLMALIGIAVDGAYAVSSFLMLFELFKQTSKMSKNAFAHMKKVVVDTIVQILIKSLFISTWAFWIVISYFVDKNVDTRAASTIINSLFVAAPIPGTISMMVQNASYRKFITETILRRKRSEVNPYQSTLPGRL
ncbi:Serpentine Receptor, class I [Caenorhabditis elegans]|uniref:Serpentine Receptor, class I n=1 Tax=Caenorhabditis elegans TaxID=6239 RepID=A0A0M7RF70_CAEEL|nr:Serpentine Receptor, class I [Caenorhabditis elegans]CUR30053.1 Serpentine Receptor, class I [Caenorhabditis elegans]|eukprot:NP_001303754.1 Uncharacterized protein CELE_W02H5.16 [Caenorhabditis elegans]